MVNIDANGAFSIKELMLGAYKQIIKYYLRHVLLRCSKYVNNKKDAEKIALYVLLTTCILAEKLEHMWQLGQLIDCMVDGICQDVMKEKSQAKEKRLGRSKALLPDKRMWNLAKAVSMLDGFTQQVIVLHHIEMMSTKEISLIYNKSISDIRLEINGGERKLVKHLSKFWKNVSVLSVGDVCLWLDELGEALDLNQRERVAEKVLGYLAEPEKALGRVQKYLGYWNQS